MGVKMEGPTNWSPMTPGKGTTDMGGGDVSIAGPQKVGKTERPAGVDKRGIEYKEGTPGAVASFKSEPTGPNCSPTLAYSTLQSKLVEGPHTKGSMPGGPNY